MFCEQCGSKLPEGARFCENCGTKVAGAESFALQQPPNVAQAHDTTEKSAILTNTRVLAAQMNCAESDVLAVLSGFAASAKSRGVEYSVVQLKSSDLNSALSEIKRLGGETKYLFIVGGQDVAQSAEWQNPSEDSDKTVTSDLPYSVLNAANPASGLRYDFANALRVGRLPVYNGEPFEEFKRYFLNVGQNNARMGAAQTFGVTALVWQNTSENVYSKFKNGQLFASPDVTYKTVEGKMPSGANLYYFNLHGSDKGKYWYGQQGGNYPEAFSPDNARAAKSAFFCGVEACYGARYIGFSKAESVLLSMMANNCLGLLGASKIAYGTPTGEGSCADILVGRFLHNLANGMTTGDAFCEARQHFCARGLDDDSDVKTLMEFDLYGDPSAKMKNAAKAPLAGSAEKSGGLVKKSLLTSRIAMPDVRLAVKTSIARTDAKIAAVLEDYMNRAHSEMQGAAPVTLKVSSTKTAYQNIYAKQGEWNKVVKVYYDEHGNVTKDIESK